MERKSTYNPTIDILRVLAIFAVVAIHTTTRELEASHFDLVHLPLTLFLNQAARFAVPLFFLISGFVLELNYHAEMNYLTYFKKRISRILLPYIVWSFIYFLLVYTSHPFGVFDIRFLIALLEGMASYQLYFIPSLLIFYALFPYLRTFLHFFSRPVILFILGILEIAFLGYDYYTQQFLLSLPIRIALLNYYMFLLGMVASHHEIKITRIVKRTRFLLLFLTCGLAFYIFSEGRNLYLQTKNYLYFYSQWRPSVFFYTLTLGSLLYILFKEHEKWQKQINTLSGYAFFVFFIHVIILEFVWFFIGKPLYEVIHTPLIKQLIFDPIFFSVVVTISFLLAFIAHKIPKLKYILG